MKLTMRRVDTLSSVAHKPRSLRLPALVLLAIGSSACLHTPAWDGDGRHDYELADTPNEITALRYLYTAWNDRRFKYANETFWAPGAYEAMVAGKEQRKRDFGVASADSGYKPPPPPTYSIRKVISDGDFVVVLAFVEGVGIGDDLTDFLGQPIGPKIGDAVVEIFEMNSDHLIVNKWDTVEPLSRQNLDF